MKYRAVGAAALLRRNLLIYGLGRRRSCRSSASRSSTSSSSRSTSSEGRSSPMLAQLRAASSSLVAAHRRHGHRVSAPRHRRRAGRVSRAGERQPHRAGRQGGRLELIGQSFDDPKYFWGRPSAHRAASPYNAGASGGSNLGPTNPALVDEVKARIDALPRRRSRTTRLPVPVDLVTSSASGLDPDICPPRRCTRCTASPRRAAATTARVRALVARHTEGRTLGRPGRAARQRARLNLALDNPR